MFWLVRRIGTSVLMLILVTSVVFLTIRMVPGDPVQLLLGESGGEVDIQAAQALRHRLGLDRPLMTQYVDNVSSIVTFRFGNSLVSGAPIGPDIMQRFPRTLELVGWASVIALVFGIPGGVLAALRKGQTFDRAASWFASVGQSLPVFVIGALMVLVFAQTLRIAPAGGYASLQHPLKHFSLVLMPAMAIGIGFSAMIFRITRTATLEVLPLDYVRTARAKGVAPRRIIVRHVLRNSLMPIVTVFGLQVGSLLSGTVLVEYVFNYPGLSGMLINAVAARDYPAVTAILAVTATAFILINLLVDIAYGFLDPRVRR
ncbi:ABC transporter permease [Paraburkholderia caledonica]|uniref:Peptide/nickel transport system permease protein n=1 Tax=Paraburkholderia caledonica TaxID=134536 RepID=A0AB73IMK8_9BURK|nr:peptide/nickel transport system permease protein [Paraburkholderia caledonica]